MKDIKNLMESVNAIPSLTLESMFFGQDEQDTTPVPAGEEETSVPEMDIEPETPPTTETCVDDDIVKIRQIALGAIAKLAAQPTSPIYQTMKKIWVICDKTTEAETPAKNDGSSQV